MANLVLLVGLLVLIAILAARLETPQPRESTPQHVYLRLHNDDGLAAKP